MGEDRAGLDAQPPNRRRAPLLVMQTGFDAAAHLEHGKSARMEKAVAGPLLIRDDGMASLVIGHLSDRRHPSSRAGRTATYRERIGVARTGIAIAAPACARAIVSLAEPRLRGFSVIGG